MITYGEIRTTLSIDIDTFDILKPLNLNPQSKDSDRLHFWINFALSVPVMETLNGAG